MPRIRTVKPSLFKNEHLAELPSTARLLFIGLFCLADKEGRLEDRPKRIKAEIFPYDSVDCNDLLSRLESAGFINRYEVGEIKVIQVENFTKHQRITGSEADSDSEYPYFQGERKHFGNTLETPTKLQGRQEGKGRERKGKDTGVFVPPLISEVRDYFKENGYSEFLGETAFNGYQVAGWKDSRGNKIRNWKQKMIQVWFKEDNKVGAKKFDPFNPKQVLC